MKDTVVVDGGGSRCRLGVAGAEGIVYKTAVDGPASLTLGVEQCWQNIQRGLRTIAVEFGKSDDWMPSRLCMGLAGALQKNPREHFLNTVPSSIETTLVSDGYAQLLGATNGEPGACLAIGTGSVLHWIDHAGTVSSAGGWGFPSGDEGSGAWLGSRLINEYLWYRDSHCDGHQLPLVFEKLEHRIGNTVAEIQAWSTQTRSTKLASLAPIVTSAALQNDAVAESLLSRGVNFCQQLLRIAPDTLPIYIVGGLGDTYRTRLDQLFPNRCHEPYGDAMSGLLSLAQCAPRGNE